MEKQNEKTPVTIPNFTDEQKEFIRQKIYEAQKKAYIQYYFTPKQKDGKKWIKTYGDGRTEKEGFDSETEAVLMLNGIDGAFVYFLQELNIPL